MTRLADIIPFNRISPGLLLVRLEQAWPDLVEWSRSHAADAIAPRQLASLVLGALPAAFDVGIEELIADPRREPWGESGAPTIINRPYIDILSPGGRPRWSLPLSLSLTAPIPEPGGDPGFGSGTSVLATLELSIIDAAGAGQQQLLFTPVNIVVAA